MNSDSNDRATERLAYSRAEVAERLGISLRHVANLVKSGEIPTVRLGNRVLIPADDLARLLDTRGKR